MGIGSGAGGVAEMENHDPTAAESSLRTALALAGGKDEDIRLYASMRLALTLKVFNQHAEADAEVNTTSGAQLLISGASTTAPPTIVN